MILFGHYQDLKRPSSCVVNHHHSHSCTNEMWVSPKWCLWLTSFFSVLQGRWSDVLHFQIFLLSSKLSSKSNKGSGWIISTAIGRLAVKIFLWYSKPREDMKGLWWSSDSSNHLFSEGLSCLWDRLAQNVVQTFTIWCKKKKKVLLL